MCNKSYCTCQEYEPLLERFNELEVELVAERDARIADAAGYARQHKAEKQKLGVVQARLATARKDLEATTLRATLFRAALEKRLAMDENAAFPKPIPAELFGLYHILTEMPKGEGKP